MIDKLDLRIPSRAYFTSDFRFIGKEVVYAGLCSTVSRSQHYQGVVNLRPFGIDAMLHAYKRRAPKDSKLELFDTGIKTLDDMAELVKRVFEVDVPALGIMRVDLAADIPSVRVEHLRNRLRVKFKRSIDERGELDYANVGGRSVGYFRYGKSPNCLRVYDKPPECRARLPEVLKRCNPDAELPTFEELFGFPQDAVLTRIERQCGGNRLPPELRTFADLRRAADFNPFKHVEITPEEFPFPSVEEYGVAARTKLIGIAGLVGRVGLQQARSELNRDGNGKRYWQLYEEHLRKNAHHRDITIEQVVQAYQVSTHPQVEAQNKVDRSEGGTHNGRPCEATRENPQIFPGTRTDWRADPKSEANA